MRVTKPWASGEGRTTSREHSKLRRTILVCVLVAAGIVCGGAPLAAAEPDDPDATGQDAQARIPREVQYLCARESDGLLRYVESPSQCVTDEEDSLKLPDDGPIYACASRSKKRLVRQVSSPEQCSPKQIALTLAGDKALRLCASKKTGLLHFTRNCRGKPVRVIILAAPANQAPVAEDQSVTADEDATDKGIALTASDPEGDALSYAVVDSPTHGRLAGTAPDLSYTPDPDYNGSDSFTFKANDGKTDGNTATVDITVNAVDDEPDAVDDDSTSSPAATTDEDTSTGQIDVLSNDTGLGDGSTSVTIENQGANGTATVNSNKTVTYTPEADTNGSDSFVYKVCDGDSTPDCDTATVSIAVNAINDEPTANGQSVTTDEDVAKNITLGAADVDGDTLSYLASDPAHGTLSGTGAALTYTPDPDFNGSDSFTFTASDSLLESDAATVSITVTPVNDAPTDIELSNDSVPENEASGTTVGDFSSIDKETGDTHTYSLVTGTGGEDNDSFTIDAGGTLKTDESFDYNTKSSYSILVRTTDNGTPNQSFEETFTILVTDVNEAPTDIALSSTSVAENLASGASVGTLSATDGDATQTHAFTLENSGCSGSFPDNDSFGIDGSTLEPAESFDYEAKSSYSICLRVTDSGSPAASYDEEFTITVSDANDTPTNVSLSNASVAENEASGTEVGTLSSTDQDTGDTYTYALVTGVGDDSSFQIDGDTLKTAASFDYETKSSYSVRVRTTDNGSPSQSLEKDLTISVTNANDAPTSIELSNASVAENEASGTEVGTLSSTDQDTGDTYTYALVTGVGDDSSFQIDGDTLKTAASFDYETKSSYSVRVRTTDNGSPSQSLEKDLTISVTNVNEAPTDIALSNSSVEENQATGATVGTLSATDDPGDTHTYSLVSGDGATDNASFAIDGSTLKTNAVFNHETKDSYSIRLQVTDAANQSYEEQFAVSVTDVNDVPTDIALDNASVDENKATGTLVGNLSTTDDDAGQTHKYSLVSGDGATDNASFQVASGELKTSASFNYEVKNSYSIRVRTTDNGSPNQSFEEQLTITINDVNDLPTVVNDSYSGAVGNTLAVNGTSGSGPQVVLTGNVLTHNDTDEDAGDSVGAVAESVSSTGGGTATIDANGSFTFLPGVGDKNQTDSFTYQVTDGEATASGTVQVGIADVLVWYVNNAASSNGDGRSSSPLNSLTGVNGAGGSGDSDSSGDILFLYQGSGNYTGGLPLENNQQLLGQPNGLVVNNGVSNVELVSAGGSNPTITNSSGDSVALGSNNTIRSLNVGNASGSGISGSSFGTLNVADVGINTNGQALNLSDGTLSGSGFTQLSSAGGTNNVSLSSVETSGTPALGTSSDALSGASQDAFKVSGGSGSLSYSGTISNASGRHVSVANRGGGTVTFNGAISGSGTGVSLDNNDNATVNFTGGLTLSTGTNGAFTATNGGTVNVTGSSNTLATTTGTALKVTDTNIGSNGLTFRSISANGATNGIVLNNTGTSGGLTVTGSGTTANSGGTIQNTTGDAVSLNSTGGHSFNLMRVANPQGDGFEADELSGTNSISKSLIEDVNVSQTAALNVENKTATNGALTLDANTIRDQTNSNGHSMVMIRVHGGVNFDFDVVDSNTSDGFESLFTNLFGSALNLAAGENTFSGDPALNYAGHLNITVSDSKFRDAFLSTIPDCNDGDPTTPCPGGLNDLGMAVQGNSTMNFSVTNNLFDNVTRGNAGGNNTGVIGFNALNNGRISGNPAVISGNTIQNLGFGTHVNELGSGGIRVAPDNSSPVTHKVLIQNNTVKDTWRQGIYVSARDRAVLNAKLEGNTVGTLAEPVGQSNRRGMELESQSTATLNADVLNSPSIVGAGTSGSNSSLAIRSTESSLINATVLGNTIKNTNAANTAGRFRAQTVDGITTGSDMCLDLRNNTLEDASRLYELINGATGGTFGRNISGNTGTVRETGSFSSVASCPRPGF